ncbi:hypothetical protein HPP92_022563 [Vanilla planifolia]|uniref:Proline dehydrogenase n=1 Tax=Vanilla planifolia TaxID=51239 RepID=A0A835UFF7_VANPL|nr:hypothetical protein HPP92_022563 [Vanilla planifolia]
MAISPISRLSLLPRLPRFLSSFTATPSAIVAPEAPTAVKPIIDLGDTDRLFAAEATGRLAWSLATMYALAVGPAVDLGIAVMRSRAVMENAALRAAVMAAVRGTVYRQFCAGEETEEASETLRRLWEKGLRGILDYGLEDAEDAGACDRNLAGFMRTVDVTPALPDSSVSFACVKITAITPISLLERVSDLLRWEKKNPSLHLPWKQPSLPVLADSSPLYHTPAAPPPLSQEEERELRLSHDRLSALCHRCSEANLPLLVDAEYTSVQPAIDHMTFSAALEFNRQPHPLVYGTVQAYLKDSKPRLMQAVDAAERVGISLGFKLVRGAYMSRESGLAASLGVASPIHDSIDRTHACYNECASFLLERITTGGSASAVFATHNLESGKAAAAKAMELGIGKGNQKLQFAQLMGMADGLSLGLKNAGFQVSKYLPFGPVEQVMPYLLRRAEENRGFLSTSTIDRDLMRKELKRRLKVAVLGK